MSIDTRTKLSLTTVVLHWLTSIGIIVLMCVGLYMSSTDTFKLYPIHKSIGTLLFVFIVWRFIWRIKQGPLTPVSQYQRWETMLAKVVILVLLLGSVLFPLSGLLMSYFGGHGISVFGWEMIAGNPGPDGKSVPINGSLAGFAHSLHVWLLPIMAVAIVLHILGAYKHHFVDKDGTMKRILGKQVD